MNPKMFFMLVGLFVAITIEQPGFVEAACESGWAADGDSCYKIIEKESTPQECIDQCHEENAQLASIHSEEENKIVAAMVLKSSKSRLNDEYWMGLKLIRNSDHKIINSVWIDSTSMVYGNVKVLPLGTFPWGSGKSPGPQPDMDGDCATFTKYADDQQPVWVNHYCNRTLEGCICKK